MADNTSSDWSDVAPQGASSISARMYATDAALQSMHPEWPTGGTAAQIGIESRGNNNAVSPAGATGIAQMMPATFEAIKQQMGRPNMNIHNVNDQMDAHQFLMAQNLQRTNGDVNGALSLYNSGHANANNPETNHYVSQFDQKTGAGSSSSDAGWQDVTPTAKASDDGWQDIPAKEASNSGGGVMDNIKGFGLQAANIAGGALEALPIAGAAGIGMARRLIGGDNVSDALSKTVAQAGQNFQDFSPEAGLNKLGVNTSDLHNTQGYKLPEQAMNFAFDTAPTWLGKQAAIGIGAGDGGGMPVTAKDQADMGNLFKAGMIAAPLVHGLGGGEPAAAAGELDKLNAAGIPEGPQTPAPAMGPNEGPARPPITVDSAGNASDPLQPASMEQAGAEIGRQRQQAVEQQAAGDLFPSTLQDTTGQATPYDPNRENAVSPIEPDTMQGQGKLELDPVQDKMKAMQEATPEQLDIFSDFDNGAKPFDQMGGDEAPRTLDSDEFAQTIQALSEKDGTRFPMPADMDDAYSKYLDTVKDDQGGLFDRPTVAKNFADMALQESITRRIQDHPVVKANQAKLDAAQARDAVVNTPGSKAAVDAAQALLQKSTDNIGSHFKEAAKQLAPWEKDGVVYMHTFGGLGELSKSIAAVLKGIHGVVFKTLDKVLPKFRSLDSDKKLFAQSIKDAVNKQANRDWSQTVNEKPRAQLDGIPGMRKALDAYNPYEAQDISPQELKAQMVQANDIGSGARAAGINHVLQGGMQLSSFYRNPIVKFVTESVDRAQRNVKQYVRDNLLGKDGLRTKMQAMSSDELTGIRSLMEIAEGKKEYTTAELKNQGFNPKQIDYYQKSLELEKQAFSTFNDGRAKAGLPPVDRRIAHIAGYFMGDFKSLVHDSRQADALNPKGKVVAVLSHNNRMALNTIAKRFMEDHPDAQHLSVDSPVLNKLKESGVGADNRFHGYMEVLNMMKDGDVNMGQVVKAYQDHMTSDAMKAMSNRSKFKQKEGVIGAEGRKSWQSATENAKDGAQQQLRYLESISKWSEMQKAIEKSKTFLSDPEIDKPNAKALSQSYLDSVQGRNQGPIAHAMNGLLNGFADATGIGPSVLKGMNNTLKSTVLAKFVGIMKLSHSAVTLLQPILGMPFTNALMRERGLDLPWMHGTAVKSVANSLHSSFTMMTKDKTGNAFMDAAKDYMQKNGTADVGMSNHYKNVTAGSKIPEMMGNIAHANVSLPEAGARTFTFMYYAHMLQDMGLPKDEIFPTAHNAMREVMVDYGAHERPMMFGKMSLLGDIASTLTRFKYNTVGKHLIGAAEVQREGMSHVLPLVHMIGTSIAGAGIRGIFGYEAANQAVKLITQVAAQAGLMKNSTSLDEMVLKAFHSINNVQTHGPKESWYDSHDTGQTRGPGVAKMVDVANWGGLGAIGVNMTGSLSNSDTIPMDPLGALVPGQGELGTLAKSAANLAINHNKQSLKQFATNVVTPNSLKGVMENSMFTDKNGDYHNPQTGLKEVNRTPGEQALRDFSFRPLNESKRGLVARTLGNVETGDSENGQGNFTGTAGLKHDFLERAKSDIMSNGGKPDPAKMQQWAQRYVQAGGDPRSFIADMESFTGKGQHMDRLQRAEGMPDGSNLGEINRYMRGKAME